MAFQIVWSDSALERITQFLDFMSEENPERARRVVEDLFDRVKALAEHPRLGRRLTEGIDPDLRRLVIGNYIVVYRIQIPPETIVIVAVRHCRQRQLPEERW